MRGDAPYLGVVSPGRFNLYRVALDDDTPDGSRITLDLPSDQERFTFAYLGNERPSLPAKGRWISGIVLTLLSTSIDELKSQHGVSDSVAVSLVGRALFVRFLGDSVKMTVCEKSDFLHRNVRSTARVFCGMVERLNVRIDLRFGCPHFSRRAASSYTKPVDGACWQGKGNDRGRP
jgi:hypothetical protein